jgi:hypothetical protein
MRKKKNKLSLTKEVVRTLGQHELTQAAGGISFPGSICNFTNLCGSKNISNCDGCTSDTGDFY